MKEAQPAGTSDLPSASHDNDGDTFSSYGSEEYEDEASPERHPISIGGGYHEIHTNTAGGDFSIAMEDMKRFLNAVEATQGVIVAKIASIEQTLLSVQEDTSWVRGDVRLVHELVDSLAENVSLMNNTVALVEGEPNQRSIEEAAWGGWNKDTIAKAVQGLMDTTEYPEEERVELGHEEPSHVHSGHFDDSAIAETQMFERSTDKSNMVGEGVGYRMHINTESARVVCSPTGKQTQIHVHPDAADLCYGQMEMTLYASEGCTAAPGHSTWSANTNEVPERNWPATLGGDCREEWVSSKRVRQSWTAVGGGELLEAVGEEMPKRGNLNLNLSPEGVDGVMSLNGRGKNVVPRGKGRGGGGGTPGAGRGTGRGKKPPLVQPRYRSQASPPSIARHITRCTVNVYLAFKHPCTTFDLIVKSGIECVWHCWEQELLKVGTLCWVLHPRNGNRPVAEGIAGGLPTPKNSAANTCMSLLMELCDPGKQMVKVTCIHKKGTIVMYPEDNAGAPYVDDYMTPPAPSETYLTWCTQYLCPMEEAG